MKFMHCLAVAVALSLGCPVLFSPLEAGAANAKPAAQSAAAKAAAPAPAPVVDHLPDVAPDQLQNLIDTLNDPADRQELVNQLKALLAAEKGVHPDAPVPGLAERTLSFLGAHIETTSAELVGLGSAFLDLPQAAAQFSHQAADDKVRSRWSQLLEALGAAVTAGLIVRWAVARLLREAVTTLERKRGASIWRRLPMLSLRLLLDFGPIAAFIVTALPTFATWGLDELTLTSLSGIDNTGSAIGLSAAAAKVLFAIILIQTIMALARFALAPNMPGLRLYKLDEESAVYCFIWVFRIASVGVIGYFGAEAAVALGVTAAPVIAIRKITGLIVVLLLIILILQNRSSVASWLRGSKPKGTKDSTAAPEAAPNGKLKHRASDILDSRILHSVRRHVAAVWHILAILYITVSYGIWALSIESGFDYMIQATLISLTVALVARLIVNTSRKLLNRCCSIPVEWKQTFPALEHRVNRYVPLLNHAIRVVTWGVAIMTIFSAWGVDSFSWLKTSFGQRLTTSATSVLVVAGMAALAWEISNAAIDHYLHALGPNGRPVPRSARARTLMPLLRNALFIVLLTLVLLVTLSEFGVDIGPLLAGAGVIGVAVGFGSQTLIKDVITGLFILLEDTIAVGDVVDVGNGHSGQVESISIRAIRLRDLAGAVHTIPFSSVSMVINLTKDFAYYVFDIAIAYDANIDQAIALVKKLGDDLRADPVYASLILLPFEVMGVDAVSLSAVVIKARVKTKPLQQWTVGREFNRRMIIAFAEAGVPLATTSMRFLIPQPQPITDTSPQSPAPASPIPGSSPA